MIDQNLMPIDRLMLALICRERDLVGYHTYHAIVGLTEAAYDRFNSN